MFFKTLAAPARQACQTGLRRHAYGQLRVIRRCCDAPEIRRFIHGTPRRLSSTSSGTEPLSTDGSSSLTIREYHKLSDHTMEALLEQLEGVVDEMGDPGYEVEYSSGVLTLKLGEKGTYVMNKQPPNMQIWLSSPVSGPKRYDYLHSHRGWIYSRDGMSVQDLLRTELSSLLERDVVIELDEDS
ncbi:Frataxin [Schizopora paradoxa]|uniref:ferroxidase n=1 Tax=Schizopora paradoxa TaxID=27342 RepID=A0A0H2RQ13_9AGAM|nr:Frataxin [Schizopora paradoxa]